MKALVLAAGYAVRLYPLTENQPKPLISVGGKAILSHLLEKIEEIKEIRDVYVVTNGRFYTDFLRWKDDHAGTKNISILNDGTQSNVDRLGAVGDLQFVLQQQNIQEDLLVIAGDNLFGFSLRSFIDFFYREKRTVVAFQDLKDIDKVRGKYGVGVLDHHTLLGFEEKPLNPSSSLASTACYLFSAADLPLVAALLQQGKADAPGYLIRWLLEKSKVSGFVFSEHWFDVGSFESLQAAEEAYR